MVRSRDLGYRAACRADLPAGLQPVAQPGVDGAMGDRDASIVVSPGRVSLDDLAQVLAGAAVVVDPSFWARGGATSAHFSEATGAQIPGFGINRRVRQLAS